MRIATRFCCSALFFWLLFWVSTLTHAPAFSAQESSKAERDSMLALGERQMRAGDPDEAVAIFTRLVQAYPEDAHLMTRLGYAQLKNRDFDAAEKFFEAAKKLDKTRPEAYVGLGLVHVERPAKGIGAFYNYRRSLGLAKRATKLDSTYGPAYRLLGEIHERFQEDHEKAIKYYMKYMEQSPDDPEGLYYFGLACVQGRAYGKLDQHIAPYLRANPEEVRLISLVAQGYFFQGRFGEALEQFERHLQKLDEQEHELYTDVTFVASEKELETYRATSGDERIAYLEKFWKRRDPDILTNINERIIEHYRRVWYARTFFADKVHPWDRRGEVYIRYGEPDYRSRSYQRNFIQNASVEAVRTRMAVRLYGSEASFLTFTGPVYPIRAFRHPITQRNLDNINNFSYADQRDATYRADGTSTATEIADSEEFQERDFDSPEINPLNRSDFDDKDGARFDEFGNMNARLNFGDYAPVTIHNDLATVPWEAWTYTQVKDGIEFVFTDENSSGHFNFAPIPPVTGTRNQLVHASRVVEFAPAVVYERAAAEVPDYYRPGILGPGLEFYYDLASFRGPDGQTILEVYYGIPPEQIEVSQKADSTQIHVQCALALADEEHTTIYRNTEEIFYQDTHQVQLVKGVFLPELLKTEVPPGKYELQVQLKDRISGHTGIYKQAVEVRDFLSDVLQVSDIQLASAIQDTGVTNRFKKGDVWIVPMATRNYKKAQKVYVYYEIYNLKKNDFGQTRYKVQYQVQTSSSPWVGVYGAVSTGIRKLFRSRKPQVSVTHEEVGEEPTAQEYFEIDLSKAKSGVQLLKVTVEDQVSGETTTHEIRFRYGV